MIAGPWASVAAQIEPAAGELDRLVDEFRRRYNSANAKKLSRAQAFDRVFNAEDNREPRDCLKREEVEATRRVRDQRAPIWAVREFSR